MISNFKNMIEYYGVSEYIPDNIKSFKQIIIEEKIVLPGSKPKAKELIKVGVFPNIINSRIIRTAVGTSLEGIELTGFKYCVDLGIRVRTDYIGSYEGESIFTTSNILKKHVSLILPKNFSYDSNIFPAVFVEDIYAELESEESILLITTLLVMAEIES
ncbi:hypothetical protein SAMN02745163_02023 [Clostridium cavendishii DSM 21758]|uniref:SipL SPOCS domain-containing protein n=1 Tax=Clostridium cavendishii DSM 21758 TaxID=1121302 RepID=A0A1M6JG48_9CLOT|nr:hypothetical protein [Clostridium cavendishii]SHJ45688.1 hypothetical protein SAMN02745163_02023 [Clostridium cavendishii DSM 21758]